MRWLLVIALAGCATKTWDNYDFEADPAERRAFLDGLRGARGETDLAAGDRCYVIRADTLQPEISAFTGAVADAIVAHRLGLPTGDFIATGSAPVVAGSYVDRWLSVDDRRVVIKAIRADDRTYYWVETHPTANRVVFAQVASTPSADAAWKHLVDAASERAAGINYMFFGDIDSIGVDVRGIGSAPVGHP